MLTKPMNTRQLRRILCAEDDPAYREIIEVSLSREHHLEFELYPDAPSALAAVADFKPDLLVFDVQMPDLSGVEAFRQLQGVPDGSLIPIVFLTCYVQPHEVEAYLQSGACGVIAKPFDPATLGQRLQKIWDRLPGHN